jgi:DNA polymerase sigma
MVMNNNLKVLKLFIDNKDKKFTIRWASKELRINYRIAYEELAKLEKEGLVSITKIGNSKVCEFGYKFSGKIAEIEGLRRSELNKDIQLIEKRIAETKNPFYILAVFGSHVSKTASKQSDIDLCLIADNPEIAKKVNDILSITPLNVHLQEFSSGDFLSMLKSKSFNVGNEIMRNNVILHGLENFYELVNYAK